MSLSDFSRVYRRMGRPVWRIPGEGHYFASRPGSDALGVIRMTQRAGGCPQHCEGMRIGADDSEALAPAAGPENQKDWKRQLAKERRARDRHPRPSPPNRS